MSWLWTKQEDLYMSLPLHRPLVYKMLLALHDHWVHPVFSAFRKRTSVPSCSQGVWKETCQCCVPFMCQALFLTLYAHLPHFILIEILWDINSIAAQSQCLNPCVFTCAFCVHKMSSFQYEWHNKKVWLSERFTQHHHLPKRWPKASHSLFIYVNFLIK